MVYVGLGVYHRQQEGKPVSPEHPDIVVDPVPIGIDGHETVGMDPLPEQALVAPKIGDAALGGDTRPGQGKRYFSKNRSTARSGGPAQASLFTPSFHFTAIGSPHILIMHRLPVSIRHAVSAVIARPFLIVEDAPPVVKERSDGLYR